MNVNVALFLKLHESMRFKNIITSESTGEFLHFSLITKCIGTYKVITFDFFLNITEVKKLTAIVLNFFNAYGGTVTLHGN